MEQVEEVKPELEHTLIYRCKDTSCKAWVREEYATDECPLCKGPMVKSFKFLPPSPKKAKKTRKAKQ